MTDKTLTAHDESDVIVLDYPLSTFRLLVMLISILMYLFLFLAWGAGAVRSWIDDGEIGAAACLAILAVACLVAIYNFGRAFMLFLLDPIHLIVTVTADSLLIKSVHGTFESPLEQIDSFGSSSGRLRIYGVTGSRWSRRKLLRAYNTAGYRVSPRRLAKELDKLIFS